MIAKRILVAAGFISLSWLCVSPASAQTTSPYPPQIVAPVQPVQPAQPPPAVQIIPPVEPGQPAQPTPSVEPMPPVAPAQPVQPMRSLALTPEQLHAFSDLSGDSPGRVSQRLAMDPGLAPLAAAAADARMRRKSTGKVLMIVGFAILGVGDIVGTAIMVSTPGYPSNIESGQEGRLLVGVAVDLVCLGVGLALAIPGIVKMARQGDEENRALDYYAPARGQGVYQVAPPQVLGSTIALPVLSFDF
jgi:hypothetical protein